MALTDRLKHLRAPKHDQVLDALQQVLLDENWLVDREPIVGGVRPDIVARAPGGATYVIEVKDAEFDANLGAIAQLQKFRSVVSEQSGSKAKGVLVVAGELPEGLGAIAGRAGVELVPALSGTVGSVRESLTSSGLVAEPAQLNAQLDGNG